MVLNRAIIVEEGLRDGLQENLDILVEDWKREGADEVFIFSHPKGVSLSVITLKTILQSIPDLEGVLLIGELPIARMLKDPTSGPPGEWYATDYFFMDLTDQWQVYEGNYVKCQDNLRPTIFVGRLVVGEDTGLMLGTSKPTILEFYNQYLEKLHLFRLHSFQFSLIYEGTRLYHIEATARNESKAALVHNWGGLKFNP